MAIQTALKKFFNQTVTIEPFVSEGDGNKPTYGTAKPFAAKIERQARQSRADDEHTIRSRRKIFLFTQDPTISTKDRLTLPAGFEPLQPPIVDVRTVTDIPGIHHIVLET